MRLMILFSFILTTSTLAQITITNSDFSSMFAVGNEITLKENESGGSVNIGQPGGNNNWDFSSFTGNLTMDIESIDPGSAPYISEFPGATIVTYGVGDYEGDFAELYTYSSLNGNFSNLGSSVTLASQPGDLFFIKHDPARIEAALPLALNSNWSQTYTQTLFYNGSPFITSQVSQTVVVDAYGTMTLPGGQSFEALRAREVMTVNGMNSVSYLFISKSGAQVSVYAADPNPPTSGVISAEGYSWNSAFSGGSGGGVVITSPDSTYIMIAGEQDSIKYENITGTVDLYYSINNGADYELIESNYTSADGIYYWDVPDSILTTEARIKIVGVSDTTDFFFSDQFKIKPWQLTRINHLGMETEFELYEPDQDGWSFCNCGGNIWPMAWWQQFNYQTGTDPFTNQSYPQSSPFDSANASDFPNWELFVDVFGLDACYIQTPQGLQYRSAATTFWGNNIRNWNGSCAGFSLSSLMGYYYRPQLFQFIGPFTDLIDVGLTDEARYVINVFQTHQYSKEARDHRRSGFQDTPRDLLADLKAMLRKESGDARQLDYYNNNGSGGHAVVPYKLERIGETSTFNVRLYNPNNPSSFNQFIYIDSVANTWSDSTSFNWGTGSSGCFLEREVSEFFSEITFKNLGNRNSQTNTEGSERLTIFNPDKAEILITEGNGNQIGYQDSTIINTLPDAVPIIPLFSTFFPPIGYDVPSGNYSIELLYDSTATANVLFDTDLTMYNYIRYNAAVDEKDIFRYSGDGVEMINTDAIGKNINFKTIILEDSSREKVFQTDNIELLQNDSVKIKEKDRNELTFNNYGTSKSYSLRISELSNTGLMVFENYSISIPQNSGHILVPDWNNLQNQPLKILIDSGNDGTIDDSIFVSNQSTNIDDQGQLLSPDNYNLAQNFPNPFNPVTTIKFSIPERSNVVIKVFDILGNEVATLLNEERDSGVYSVDFNASGLASGLYLYRLQAGNFTETRKMVLLK